MNSRLWSRISIVTMGTSTQMATPEANLWRPAALVVVEAVLPADSSWSIASSCSMRLNV